MSYNKTTWNTGDVITAEKLNNMEDGIASGEKFVEITYSALKALRDNSELIEGTQYKITDYVCTSTDENTQVESHPFDIIVVADSESVLNENARACMKADDSYYHVEGQTDAVLSAWELKYCLDNDTSRFAWADETNGKGVIFYMKDDRGNECSYDFKSIKFKRVEITAFSAVSSLVGKYIAPSAVPEGGMTVDDQNPVYLFTFSYVDAENNDAVLDNSIRVDSWVFGNVINKLYDYADPGAFIVLNDNVFTGDSCSYNTFGYGCSHNTFGEGFNSNTFEDNCNYIGISTQHTRYYRVLNGTQGDFQSPLTLTTTAMNDFVTYVGNNSSGVLKYYCPMDSAS